MPPPQELFIREAEQSVLGGLMLQNNAWISIKEILTESDFCLPEHQILFRAIESLSNDGEPCDPVTLSEWLQKHSQLDAIGGGTYLGLLAGNTPSAANIVAYAEIVLKYAKYRELLRSGIISDATAIRNRSPEQILEEHRVQIDKLDLFIQRGKEPNKFDGGYTLDELDSVEFPPTQFCLPDLIPEGVVLLCSPPKLGKSYFCLNLCLAKATGGTLLDRQVEQCDSLYIALEDNAQSLKERVQKILVDGSKTPKGITVYHYWKSLGMGGEQDIIHHLDENPSCKLVIIDTLAKIRPTSRPNSNAYLEDYRLLNLLVDITKSHMGLTILVIHHVRKAKADDIFETISGTNGLDGASDAAIVWGRDGKHVLFNLKGRRVPYLTGDDALVMELAEDIMTWQLKGRAFDICASASRREIRQALMDGAETLKEVIEIVNTSYEAAKKLVQRMVNDGEIERTKVGRTFKLALTGKFKINEGVMPYAPAHDAILNCIDNGMNTWEYIRALLSTEHQPSDLDQALLDFQEYGVFSYNKETDKLTKIN